MAGSEYKQVAFLFTDLQIKEDTFLEDISMILNTGEVMNLHQMSFVIMTKQEYRKMYYLLVCDFVHNKFMYQVPNLFATDEKTEIMERIQARAQEQGRDIAGGEASFANVYGIFLNNVKRNLHIILCMSPIGNAFRNRLRQLNLLLVYLK